MTAGSQFVQLMAPVGPVAEAFVEDERIITSIMGPFGSAKTTSTIRKIVQSPGKQRPSPRDGVRRARWCAVRDTYGQLETNVLKSWWSWFPKDMGDWNGREMAHRLKFDIAPMDGGPPERWELEMLFRAMGDLKAEDVLKGLELTGLWLNETDTLAREVLTFGIGRVGRYPAAKDGGCEYRAVVCDFNAPDVDNWTYELFVEKKLELSEEAQAELKASLGDRFGIGFHRQPGGRDPGAENLKNLERGYYEQMMIGMPPNHVRRFVDNQFGAVRNGQPVYPEFNDEFHMAKEALPAARGVPVCLALDGGSTPALVFGQRLPGGQIRVLRELVVFAPGADIALERIGPEAFGEEAAEIWLEHYGKSEFGGAWSDPAALYGDEYADSWARLFWKAFCKHVGAAARGWKLKAAPVKGNRLNERIEPVRRLLTRSPGGQPGLLIDPVCRHLRRGFNNGYVLLRVQMSGGMGRWKDEPAKNDFSHVQDALQYLVAGLTKRGALADGSEPRGWRERADRRRRVDYGGGHFAHRA